MLKRLAIVAFIASRTCFGMEALEIPQANLQLPSDIAKSSIFIDNGTFKMVFEDESSYTFKPEFLDQQLRNVNEYVLAFILGMIWKFGSNPSMIATDCMLPEELDAVGRDFRTFNHMEPVAKAALLARPAGAYLKIYKVSGEDYGMHLCVRVRGGGGSWSEPSWTPDVTVGCEKCEHGESHQNGDCKDPSKSEYYREGESRRAAERRHYQQEHDSWDENAGGY